MELKKNYNHFLGSFVQSPFDGPSRKLQLSQGVFVPNDKPGFYEQPDLAWYRGTILTVHLVKEGAWSRVDGSAVMVAPGIAVSAFHVLEEWLPQIADGHVRMFLSGYTTSGPRYWHLGELTRVNDTDLVVLSLKFKSKVPEDGVFDQLVTTTRIPPIGEKIMVVGYRASDEHVPMGGEATFPIVGEHIKYGVGLFYSVGEVVQHHYSGRGREMKSPVVEVACETIGGMSGGPALDAEGRVFGVLSKSVAPNEDGPGVSLISMIWQAGLLNLRPYFLEGVLPERFRLIDIDPNLFGLHGREALRTEDLGNGVVRAEWGY
jgi:hypothetical protein